MKKIVEENRKMIVGVFIGLFVGGIGVAAKTTIKSIEVSYMNTTSSVANVQEAIEDLYRLTKENTPDGYIIVENGTRYVGKNPNNYVSFNGELWRMIGIFDGKIKIIRNESIGKMAWNSTGTNDWASSSLYSYLNGEYYNEINATSKNMIENATWRTGGWNTSDITTSQMYEYEGNTKGEGSSTAITTGYIGLMSASDYGYASSACYHLQNLRNYSDSNCISTNWIKLNDEWTLTAHTTQTEVFIINSDGRGDFFGVAYTISVRPSLYLKPNVYIQGGSGTSFNPYTLIMK